MFGSADKNAQARRWVMTVVSSVWAASFIADIFMVDYEPSPFIHFIMMAIVGALFGREMIGKDAGRNGNGSGR